MGFITIAAALESPGRYLGERDGDPVDVVNVAEWDSDLHALAVGLRVLAVSREGMWFTHTYAFPEHFE